MRDGFFGGWIFLFFLLFAVVPFVWGLWARSKRRQALQAWAHQRGWHYQDRADLHQGLTGGPFSRGRGRASSEVVTGVYNGRQAMSWHYTYKESSGSGKNRRTTTYHHHVVGIALPEWLPYIELTAENFFSRIFSGNDIRFEHEEFNRAWRVVGQDAKTAYDVIHPRMMERLMQPDLRGANILYEGGRLLLWRRGTPVPAAIDPALRLIDELIGWVPPFVWEDARARRGGPAGR